jgi:tartrate dehydrogenase/decarboxylase/D-malate dehydrogenase
MGKLSNNSSINPRSDRAYRIAIIPGDGVGAEVVEAAMELLGAALDGSSAVLEAEWFPWGSSYHAQTGHMMPEDGLEQLERFSAILFGAVGWPTLPDHVTLWGLRLAICQGLDQGVNVRPVRLLEGVSPPLAGRSAQEIDFVVVRENAEGEYSGVGGRTHRRLASETAIQTVVYTRRNIERVVRHACELAMSRPAKHLISVTKSNASQHASVLWDEVATEVAATYPGLSFESQLVDAMAARLILRPETVDVLVASNLHADILSDLTAALAGSLGVAPSGNYNIEGRWPSMFEPVHGSAPDIAGKGVANPIGAMLSGAMMLEHLYEHDAADRVRAAVEATAANGVLTRDLGGTASTEQFVAAAVDALRASAPEPQRSAP